MMKVLLILLFVSSTVFAQCNDLYPNHKQITVPDGIELCNHEYVAVFDKRLNGNLFSSEHFIYSPTHAPRLNAFHADKRLTAPATPTDYVKSGFDKGHMAPAADMISVDEMNESFLMSNMTPQAPYLNEHAWATLEKNVRDLVRNSEHQGAYIITGAVYGSTSKLKEIPIPTSYFKCVWIASNQPLCWKADNINSGIVLPIDYKTVKSVAPYLP
jgi:endonuclease G